MKTLILLFLAVSVVLTHTAEAMFNDDPWLTKVVTELTYFQAGTDPAIEWDIDAWLGQDFHKFWFKTEGNLIGSEFETADIELVYSQAVSPFWDRQFGVRHDLKPASRQRNWLSFGYIGTAPYFVDVDARIFLGEESSSQLLIEIERELMLTQSWVLTPELDIIANGRTNEQFAEGSGLAEIEFSLRLGYEPSNYRKLQPFIGLIARQSFGASKRLLRSANLDDSGFEATVGLHAWF